jgi:hypothetical protein
MDTPGHGFWNAVSPHGFEQPISHFDYSRRVVHELPHSLAAIFPNGGQLINTEVPLERCIGAFRSVHWSQEP